MISCEIIIAEKKLSNDQSTVLIQVNPNNEGATELERNIASALDVGVNAIMEHVLVCQNKGHMITGKNIEILTKEKIKEIIKPF